MPNAKCYRCIEETTGITYMFLQLNAYHLNTRFAFLAPIQGGGPKSGASNGRASIGLSLMSLLVDLLGGGGGGRYIGLQLLPDRAGSGQALITSRRW